MQNMQQWTNEMWTIAGVAFVLGLIVGYFILRLTKDNVKKHVKLEKEFKKVQAEQEVQKKRLETHFSESAVLLSTLAQDYKKLYTHLADGSEKLLPEAHSIDLFKQLQLENSKEESQSEEEKVVVEPVIEVETVKEESVAETDVTVETEEKTEEEAKS
ncbi:YhcB family protein [Phocoenobacter skyensis]|uniref:Z-ring associated protein G n=1 Tax=Phocoenobacter skyensis TaxID=97481 RepID=A0A1H7U0Z1_9PAST|nr:DUF1043 family protein [Pasteurella skyensis]MDP8078698.1 DUF1043 family protein [Pasteurella skyensis]MDP8084692.1 DUF1043 family protein [Pasteurella skyensis]MDP8184162.1 DUF1043 family protein [Pasteurella skyensis]SEL90474.1 hypothetical protein SAMN05444853_101107 [Pasteurella skyensis]